MKLVRRTLRRSNSKRAPTVITERINQNQVGEKVTLRRSATWMTIVDERILEHIDQEGWASPELIANGESVDVSAGFVEERLQFLEYAGMVYRFARDMWELTSTGQRYLDGDLDARHQPTPTVDRVLRG